MNSTDPLSGPGNEDAAAVAFAALLPPGRAIPLELGGMTAILRAICPGEITADIQISRRYRLDASELGLSDEQRETLKASPREPVCKRSGYLIDAVTRERIARTSAVILLRRVPWTCRTALGLTAAGNPVPGRTTTPIATALRQRNMSRVQLATDLTPGHDDGCGNRVALRSEAILKATLRPLALVTEFVYEEFLAMYPPASWPASSALNVQAARRPA